MITIVVGGQYGGEGKGKIAAFLAESQGVDVACRCGGPNSSHTVITASGEMHRLRMLPTAVVSHPKIEVFFGAGTLIHIKTLLDEISEVGFRGTLRIDPRAGIVTDKIVEQQRADDRYKSIGSTLTGTGYASAMRSLRTLKLASDFPEISEYVHDLSPHLMNAVAKGKSILIEGHQGYGLSNYHGQYPYTSSRDSTAASMLAEIGLGPNQKNLKVVMVAKIFPTRNHQGELGEEMSVEEATTIGIREYGGGSWGLPDRRRRVGYIDVGFLRRAAFANSASEIALTGADYFDRNLAGCTSMDLVTNDLRQVVSTIERTCGAPVRYLSTGPKTMSVISLGEKSDKSLGKQRKNREGVHGFPFDAN